LRRDFVSTWFTPLATASFARMEEIFQAMEDEGREAVRRSGVATAEIAVSRSADMRYVGQEHAVTVELPLELFCNEDRAGIKRRFDSIHDVRYGHSAEREPAEIVSLRSAITGVLSKPRFEPIAAGGGSPSPEAERGSRPVSFDGRGFVSTPTFNRTKLLAGNRIAGPALVEEHASTTVVFPGDELTVDAFGNLVIEIARN
jgi:N-methylhydantoinase A